MEVSNKRSFMPCYSRTPQAYLIDRQSVIQLPNLDYACILPVYQA